MVLKVGNKSPARELAHYDLQRNELKQNHRHFVLPAQAGIQLTENNGESCLLAMTMCE